MGSRRANGDGPQVKGKRASGAAAPRPPIPRRPPPPPVLAPFSSARREGGGGLRVCVCVCVCVCMYACVCARKCGSPVCEFRVWLGVGCVLHALVRALSVKWVWSELRCGACACVCTFVGCTFLPGWSGTVWVRSGCGCVPWMLLPGSVVVLECICVCRGCSCVPGAACVHVFVWCVFTLSCVGSRWVYGR